MSGTTTAPAAPQPTSNVSTPAAVTGASSAAGIVLIWGLSQFHVEVPPEVALAMLALAAPIVHWVVVRLNQVAPEKPTTTGVTTP